VKFLFFLSFIFISCSLANPLQDAINSAPKHSTITLSAGTYLGNIVINKPLTIVAKEKNTIIQGDNKGSVITIKSSYVKLKNLTITNSGTRMDQIDAAISMDSVSSCEIDNCKLLNSLYGIDMAMVKNSKFTNNYITSKNLDISMRGDGLKLYYSHNNSFKNNTIKGVRDITLNYSHANTFEANKFLNNRFATHLSLSDNNSFVNNIYTYNSVSIMVMGAKNTTITNNTIKSSKGAAGIGVVINGVSNFKLEKNILKFNAKAIYIDGQEKALGMKRYINYNDISYNAEAIHFHASIKDNTITHNKFIANIDDVVKDIDGGFQNSNIVEYNYWDRYTGFDRDMDNIGDSPHKIYQYADQLWHYNNKVKFFYASPIMTLLNFLANIAPFVEPNLIFVDSKPLIHQVDTPHLQ
jgi:nitrous oxidase accessory protein